jgi:tetratricopeptide (TPR) repeat protein
MKEAPEPPAEEPAVPKVTASEIFGDAEILPEDAVKERKRHFFDLSEVIRGELTALQAIYTHQRQAGSEAHEKELGEIVDQFREGIETKFGKQKKADIHYSLGIAYMEQDLIDEAIEEFKLAAEEERLRLDSFSFLGLCSGKKGSYDEALQWIGKALQLAGEGTSQYFPLTYEKALIHYKSGRQDKALELFQKVYSWNPKFREVSHQIAAIKNQKSSSAETE